jgi:hypothetical protein
VHDFRVDALKRLLAKRARAASGAAGWALLFLSSGRIHSIERSEGKRNHTNMNEDVDLAILELISDEGARWTWYSLDRALATRGLTVHGNIASIANALAERGLIDQIRGEDPAMPTYNITAQGRKLLTRPI